MIIDIDGLTPSKPTLRKLFIFRNANGDFVLSTEHPTSANGWAIRITDPNELKKLRDAVDEALQSAP